MSPRVTAAPPVLTMVAAWWGFIMALLLPSRTTGDLLAGMWHLLSGTLGAVPRTLVWDNEAGIGQHHRLTVGTRAFAGTLGTRIYQTRPRDPEAKGVVEHANRYLQTSFLPGRAFASPADFNTQLEEWLPRANQRTLRRTGTWPSLRVGNDAAAMMDLPPVAPSVGMSDRVWLGRDYHVRVLGNDYSVDPTAPRSPRTFRRRERAGGQGRGGGRGPGAVGLRRPLRPRPATAAAEGTGRHLEIVR